MWGNSPSEPNTFTMEFLDWEKALGDFYSLRRDREAAMWAMGELVERLFGALYASEGIRREFAKQGVTLNQFGREVGLTPQALRALRLTVATFPPRERLAALSYEHHQVVAALLSYEAPSIRRRWLRDAAKQRWSVRQLKGRLKERVAASSPLSARERVERLRRQLAEAEAELARSRHLSAGKKRS